MAITTAHYTPASDVTCRAKSALKAGTFVQIGGPMEGRLPSVEPAAANAPAFGVAAADVPAGELVVVYRVGYILDVTASAVIEAGAAVSTAASGKAVTATTGPTVAIALTKATGANKPLTVALV